MTNKKRKKYAPLRSFSWSDSSDKTNVQILIENTVTEWYEANHPQASRSEILFINSLPIYKCPFCGSDFIVKNGHNSRGIQRYLCRCCGNRFNPLTNTIFDSRKIPISEWIEYLLHLFEFHSITSTSFDNRNSPTTGKYWLRKVFEVLKGIQDDIVLDGRIYLDETYFSKIRRQIDTKDGKQLRGISRNKIGVGVAFNDRSSIFIVTGTSKPSFTSTKRTYMTHIAKGSTLIHDDEKSHAILIEELGLKSISYSSVEIKNLEDKENPLYEVNRLHFLMKQFIRNHGGYDREHLQDWMNLFWFIVNEPKDKYDKVLKFIELAINSPKRVKYRDVMSKSKLK